MSLLDLCRLCTRKVKLSGSQRLFEKQHQKLLERIKEFSGIELKNDTNLPQHICMHCQEDLDLAYQFLKRCITAQQYFDSIEYKEQINTNKSETKAKTTVSGRKNQHKQNNTSQYMNTNTLDTKQSEASENIEADTSNETTASCNLLEVSQDKPAEEQTIPCDNTKLLVEPYIKAEKCNSDREVVAVEQSASIKNEFKPCKKKRKLQNAKPNNFICDQCGNNFTCRHHFLTHLRRHTGDKQFQCELCMCKFFTHSELSRHMRRHTGERPYACIHCGRRFTDYSTRIKHERTHTNERPFSCVHCTKAFTTSYILKNHMLTHTGERCFSCGLCNKFFQRQTHLAVHYRSIMHKQNEERQQQQLKAKNPAEITQTNSSNETLIEQII